MKQIELLLAEKLLHINAINLQPDNPFTWASGWYSPIYTDFRRTLSYPDLRSFIKLEMARYIYENVKDIDAIAGVSTGANAYGALVSDVIMRPYVYVRATPKDHGLENSIEGNLRPGMKVVVIEDVISTGQTSMKAIEVIRNAGCEVVAVAAFFDYEFPEVRKKLKARRIPFFALTTYRAILKAAKANGLILTEDETTLENWHSNPAEWLPFSDEE